MGQVTHTGTAKLLFHGDTQQALLGEERAGELGDDRVTLGGQGTGGRVVGLPITSIEMFTVLGNTQVLFAHLIGLLAAHTPAGPWNAPAATATP